MIANTPFFNTPSVFFDISTFFLLTSHSPECLTPIRKVLLFVQFLKQKTFKNLQIKLSREKK